VKAKKKQLADEKSYVAMFTAAQRVRKANTAAERLARRANAAENANTIDDRPATIPSAVVVFDGRWPLAGGRDVGNTCSTLLAYAVDR
jgi:hypothetical protein